MWLSMEMSWIHLNINVYPTFSICLYLSSYIGNNYNNLFDNWRIHI